MKRPSKLIDFTKPYTAPAILALVMLAAIVVMDLAIPRLVQRIIDQGIRKSDQGVILSTAAIMLGLTAASTVFALGNNTFSVRVGEGVARDLREAIFQAIESFSYGNLDRQRTGQLMVRLTSDVSALKMLTQVSLRIGTRAPLMMIGGMILMVNTSARLALTLLPLLVVTALLIALFVWRMEPLFEAVQKRLDKLNTVLQENIAGARLVKAFVRAEFEGERFEDANNELMRRSTNVMRFMSTMGPVLTICVNIGMVVVIYSGGLQAIRGEMSVGQIVAFTNYLMTTMIPLVMMTMLTTVWAAGLASERRVREVLETEPEIKDASDAIALPAETAGRVTFEGVTFNYAGTSDEPVLSDINLTAEPGRTLAILGATGSGKSTLVNLIPRFYDVKAGRVLYDGVDVRKITQESLLGQIGIVPQEALLFSGTVRENIAYGKADASEEEVISAAKAAQAHDFIMALSKQYDTHVEPRGANFSGGQKQRIAIARALLLRPKVLILDDSTSAVDVETETKIQEALRERLSESTSFVVAQRVSTVLKADVIIVLDKGRIAARGTHAELLKSSPIYREIYDSQLGAGAAQEAAA